MPERPHAVLAMAAENVPYVFPPDLLALLRAHLDLDPALVVQDLTEPRARVALARAEVLVTGWGCPRLDAAALDGAPKLRAVLHAAGSVKGFTTAEVWRRGILVSSAADANALPVAEYALAMILLTGKDVFALREELRARRGFPYGFLPGLGNHGRRVGVVGASRVGRRLIELLRPHDLAVTLADPTLDAGEAGRLGVPLLPLDDLLRTSDIVTLHAPETPATRHLIGARELALMPTGAVLLNTARGSLVDQDALVAEVRTGRLRAVLDVTDPEPPPAGSPLFDLPGAFVTPHLAGSQGNEVARLGRVVVEEAARWAAGAALRHAVDPETLERMA
ncbi:hydroxyacid dehydrogenase [Streptomyces griseofuscus]|uniref:hydroxyacid dehydrogenase n=1 Tax=Streptomyces griseofuscus TaxID=146922 RepID=UPI0033EA7508